MHHGQCQRVLPWGGGVVPGYGVWGSGVWGGIGVHGRVWAWAWALASLTHGTGLIDHGIGRIGLIDPRDWSHWPHYWSHCLNWPHYWSHCLNWPQFGVFWRHLASIWCLLASFGLILATFGLILPHFSHFWPHFVSFWLNLSQIVTFWRKVNNSIILKMWKTVIFRTRDRIWKLFTFLSQKWQRSPTVSRIPLFCYVIGHFVPYCQFCHMTDYLKHGPIPCLVQILWHFKTLLDLETFQK